jgi:glycosyltransferase involved in cell wall biosynthesis
MRILVLTPYIPLLTKPRPYNFILHLAKQHDIYLLSFEDIPHKQLEQHPDYEVLTSQCRYIETVPLSRMHILFNLVQGLFFSSLPLRVNYYGLNFARDYIRMFVQQHRIDVIHIDRSRFAGLVQGIDKPKVLDLTDSISWYLEQCRDLAPFYFKPLYKLELKRMRQYEKTVGSPFDQCLITSPLDRERFRDTPYYDHINVVPNAVNAAFFSQNNLPSANNHTMLFFGNLSYHPNVDGIRHFATHVFPAIQEKIDDVKLHILGNKPAREVQYLEQNPAITVTGWVPSLVEYIASVSVVISPLRIGVGFPNKIAESLAMGKAVVSTETGCQGLAGSEQVLAIARDDAEFATHVIQVLQDSEFRKQLEKRAWQYARESLNPMDAFHRLDDVYAKLTHG